MDFTKLRGALRRSMRHIYCLHLARPTLNPGIMPPSSTLWAYASLLVGPFSRLTGSLGVALLLALLPCAETDAAENRRIADLGLDLIWVEPGSFLMGSAPEEEDRDRAEGPQTRVGLTKGFWLARTEMTQAQYAAIAGVNPSHFKASGLNAPVEEVSWLDATEFCRVLTERERRAGRLPEGYAYALPTEAQWEYACRAGTTSPYAGRPDSLAWHDQNSDATTHPVALMQPNHWGFYDMSGNVLEWCADWYGPYLGGEQVDPIGPSSGHFRMARGGSWRMAAAVGRSAARSGGSAGRRDYTLGFRLALVPTP